jgi:hypothetical protein
MTIEKILPTVLIVIDVCAAVVYLWQGDIRHFYYWICAGGITAAATF